MTQKQFIEKFSEKTGRTKTDSKEIVNDFLDLIVDTLMDNEPVNLYGFGSFAVAELKSCSKWSLSRKEYFQTNPRLTVRFKPGDSLLKALGVQPEEN